MTGEAVASRIPEAEIPSKLTTLKNSFKIPSWSSEEPNISAVSQQAAGEHGNNGTSIGGLLSLLVIFLPAPTVDKRNRRRE